MDIGEAETWFELGNLTNDIATGIVAMDLSFTLHKNRPVCFYLVVQRDIFYMDHRRTSCMSLPCDGMSRRCTCPDFAGSSS